MSEQLGTLDLAALISSRICHDVINPVGAISNGLEMLAEEPDEEMRVQAMELIRNSARQASAKLQFARLAFGAAGSAGAEIDLRDAEKVARDFVQGGKHTLEWKGPAGTLAKNKVKLLLNLVALGVVALPRGGVVTAEIVGELPDVVFTVTCKGDVAKLNEHVTGLLAGANGAPVDSHSIQPYYANLVAKASGLALSVETKDGEVMLKAT
jgi:histidine phosphotransferase ChpT